MKLLSYILESAKQCVLQSRPLIRPLVYLWPDDPQAVLCEDEFLLGDDLLAAPLLKENAAEREVYLPEGQWIDFFTRKAYMGRQIITAGGNGKLPVFIRPENRFLLEISVDEI